MVGCGGDLYLASLLPVRRPEILLEILNSKPIFRIHSLWKKKKTKTKTKNKQMKKPIPTLTITKFSHEKPKPSSVTEQAELWLQKPSQWASYCVPSRLWSPFYRGGYQLRACVLRHCHLLVNGPRVCPNKY